MALKTGEPAKPSSLKQRFSLGHGEPCFKHAYLSCMPKNLRCRWLLYMFRCLEAMMYKLGASSITAPKVSTRADNHHCHVLKFLWMTLALVCRWEAAYGRDFPNCRGLHAYPLKLKKCSMALKISEHPFTGFFWVIPWNQLTVSFHWQQCTLKGQIYTKGYR